MERLQTGKPAVAAVVAAAALEYWIASAHMDVFLSLFEETRSVATDGAAAYMGGVPSRRPWSKF